MSRLLPKWRRCCCKSNPGSYISNTACSRHSSLVERSQKDWMMVTPVLPASSQCGLCPHVISPSPTRGRGSFLCGGRSSITVFSRAETLPSRSGRELRTRRMSESNLSISMNEAISPPVGKFTSAPDLIEVRQSRHATQSRRHHVVGASPLLGAPKGRRLIDVLPAMW